MKRHATAKAPFAVGNPQVEDVVVEVPVLLESWLLTMLESAANSHGMSSGTLVRRLIRDFLYCSDGDLPAECAATDAPEQEDATV
jgi:hypothetical protein